MKVIYIEGWKLDLGILFVIFIDWSLGFFRLRFFVCFVFMDGSVGVLCDWGLRSFIFHFVRGSVVPHLL